jgi:hypothetical protein
MSRNLAVVRNASVAVRHTAEDKSIVFDKREYFAGVLSLLDLKFDL